MSSRTIRLILRNQCRVQIWEIIINFNQLLTIILQRSLLVYQLHKMFRQFLEKLQDLKQVAVLLQEDKKTSLSLHLHCEVFKFQIVSKLTKVIKQTNLFKSQIKTSSHYVKWKHQINQMYYQMNIQQTILMTRTGEEVEAEVSHPKLLEVKLVIFLKIKMENPLSLTKWIKYTQ